MAGITRQARGIPTEVVLDESDGIPHRCVASLDNLGEAWKVTLVDRITTLPADRMLDVCRALAVAVEC